MSMELPEEIEQSPMPSSWLDAGAYPRGRVRRFDDPVAQLFAEDYLRRVTPFYDLLSARRRHLGSLAAVADEVGLSRPTVTKVVDGSGRICDVTFVKLCAVFGLEQHVQFRPARPGDVDLDDDAYARRTGQRYARLTDDNREAVDIMLSALEMSQAKAAGLPSWLTR